MKSKAQIIYKRDFCRHLVILKPDTCWWRLRYWVNQYGAMVTAWLIKPIVIWNYRFWRLNEAEETIAMYDIHRIGMRVKEPEPYILRIQLPFWIRRNKQLLRKAFFYFRDNV